MRSLSPTLSLVMATRANLRHLFARLHAVAHERDEYVDRAAALAARLLLYGRGEVAGLYLLDRLR
jgi:hypothetical protein